MGTFNLRLFATVFLGAQVVISVLLGFLLPRSWIEAIPVQQRDYLLAVVLGISQAQAIIAASILALVRLSWLPRIVASLCLVALAILATAGFSTRMDQHLDATFLMVIVASTICLTAILSGILLATSWFWRLHIVFRSTSGSLARTNQFGLWQLLACITAVATLLGAGRWFVQGMELQWLALSNVTSMIAITFAIIVVFAGLTGLLTLIGWLSPSYLYLMVPLTLVLAIGIAMLEWPAIEMSRNGGNNYEGLGIMLMLNGVQYFWLSLSLLSARLAGFRLVVGETNQGSPADMPIS